MGRSIPEMIRGFAGNVEAVAGTEVRAAVIEGGKKITARAGGAATARWMKNAIDRLDHVADEETCGRIMEACGRACIAANPSMVARVKSRRRKFTSLDDFLAAEQRKPLTGTRLERQGDILFHTYTPQEFRPGMRCFCALVKELPAKEKMSSTYCLCSRAFIKTFWEEALGRPVKVDVLETALTGSKECRFRIEM